MIDIPPEDPQHPDIECPSCKNGVMMRWCPRCKGYHHKEPRMWEENHRVWDRIDPVTGDPGISPERWK